MCGVAGRSTTSTTDRPSGHASDRVRHVVIESGAVGRHQMDRRGWVLPSISPQKLETCPRLTRVLQSLRWRTMEEKKLELKLPVFVLEDAVLLPGAVARLDTDASGAALARAAAASEDKRVVVALSTESELGVHPMATLARVEAVGRDGGVIVAAVGRVRVLEFMEGEPLPSVRVEEVLVPPAQGTEVEALALEARRIARDILALLPAIPAQVAQALDAIKDPGALADLLSHHVPAETSDKHKELARLKKLPEQSPEKSVSRSWLQWIADLPWGVFTEDNLEVENARNVLDADHHGLEKVKKRVLQFLAVRKLRGDLKGPILCLVGAPGVGKTSLGQSIARAMGRKFARVSLGGVRDEAEIRGHRRTYVGALPGRIVQALKRVGTANPVLMLDEIDKLGAGYQGDPSAALLEVLDPEQNKAFADHYLEVPFDLSKILFIATANTLETIPPALRDRMEVLEIPSYTSEEKAAISRAHLLPKQLEAHGLSGVKVELTDEALNRVIAAHTREAGVRGLEKRLADVCRTLAVEKASGTLVEPRRVEFDEIEPILGPDRFQPEVREDAGVPGVAAGLAWTPVGGEVLYVEALRMPGKGQLILSGQLGDVMKESARAALSYVQANAVQLGVGDKPLEGWDVHVHVPAGATPKDGPSAGVTLFTALVSLLSGVPVRTDTAMTGEATLRGRVLPVGGIKEKVLAAHRLGLKRVVIPQACAAELREIPQHVRDELEIVLVKRMDEVLNAALDRPVPQLRVAA